MFHRDKLGMGESGPYLFSGFGMASAPQEQVQPGNTHGYVHCTLLRKLADSSEEAADQKLPVT